MTEKKVAKTLKNKQKQNLSLEKDSIDNLEQEAVEVLSQRFTLVSVFSVIMLLLASAILWTGVSTASQTQKYRQDYKTLQEMKQEYLRLQVEHKRLLIEQQTFSATPQIASRAVSELQMHFPEINDRLILQSEQSINSSIQDNEVSR